MSFETSATNSPHKAANRRLTSADLGEPEYSAGDPFALFIASHGPRTFAVVNWILLVTMVVTSVQNFLAHGYIPNSATIPTTLLLIVVLWLLKTGRFKAAFATFLWGSVGGGIFAGFVVAGMQTPALLFLPLASILTGWLLGARQGWLMLALVSLGLAAIAWQQSLGQLPAQTRDPSFWAIAYIAICAVGAVLSNAMTQSVREQYQRAAALGTELKGLLDSATEVAIISVDLAGRISLFNPGAERMLGYSAQEMLGQSPGRYNPDSELTVRAKELGKRLGRTVEASPQELIAAIAEIGGMTRNSTYLCKDGHKVRVSVVTSVVRDAHGGPTGLVSIGRDITAQLNAEADLLKLNLQLENRVRERTEELSQALDQVKRMQDDLIQSEKLASLGSMVAGVSHELNTPIGNAVTVASTLMGQAKTLGASFRAGELKRSELASGLGGIAAMAELIDRSVNRAATLIASFKQVAIDQTSERRREFDLRAVVDDIIGTLLPGLHDQPWQIENHIPPGIDCDSFPGPLGQIVTNLIQNAVMHAFTGREAGTIIVTAKSMDERLELVVRDDGVGMDSATLIRVFDPFFTTKLGKGGSGLGLAICYRISNTVFAGELKAISSPGVGSSFVLTMPKRTPGML